MSEAEWTERGIEAIEIVRAFLSEMGMEPQAIPFAAGGAFRVAFDGPADHGFAQIHAGIERFAFVFAFPQTVDVGLRPAVAEFIVRANWGIIDGSFEMDFDSGALAYRVGLDFSFNGLTAPLVRNMILSGMNNIEDYAAELLEVVAGTMEPRAAASMAQSRLTTHATAAAPKA